MRNTYVASQLPVVPNHPHGTFTLAVDRGKVPVEPVAVGSEAPLVGGALRIYFDDKDSLETKYLRGALKNPSNSYWHRKWVVNLG